MSNERFDNLMKKKLESVRPGYQPSAWNRFQKRLPPVGFWAWILNYGGWVLSGLMLAGWVTTLYTLHENRQVMEALSNRLVATVPTPSVTPTPVSPQIGSATNHRVDTVYMVQRTIVEHRHVYEPVQEDNRQQTNRSIRDRKPDQNQPVLSTPQQQELVQSIPQAINQSPSPKPNKTSNSLRVATSSSQPLSGKGAARQETNQNHKEKPSAILNPADSMNRAIAQATAMISIDSARVASAKPESGSAEWARPDVARPTRNGEPAAQTDSVARKPTTTTTSVAVQLSAEPAKQSRPPFRLSSLQPRIGIEAMATFNGVGVGPALELFPTENLGLSVGVQASQLQIENHKELRDFNSATGTEFIERYRAFLPAQYDQIKDISVRTSLVSLPVNVKYYVPLRRAWSLLFQAGTSFDLAAYQQVRYESYFKGAEQFHSFEIDARPRFFHNFMFGAGIQYQRSRMSAQLSPYYVYDFRSLTNTPTGSNVGVKASVWLNLYK